MPSSAAPLSERGTCGGGAGAAFAGDIPTAAPSIQVVLPGHQSEPAEMELTECGPSCACFSGCGLGFSTAAAELAPLVSLRWGEGKGSGVYADEALPARMVVGHYAGEYVSNLEAAKRLREYDAAGGGHALLVRRGGVGWADGRWREGAGLTATCSRQQPPNMAPNPHTHRSYGSGCPAALQRLEST